MLTHFRLHSSNIARGFGYENGILLRDIEMCREDFGLQFDRIAMGVFRFGSFSLDGGDRVVGLEEAACVVGD